METLKNVVVFTVGFAAGAAVGIFAVRKHYNDLAQEEIDSVKEVMGHRKAESNNADTYRDICENYRSEKEAERNLTVEDFAEREHPTEDYAPVEPYVISVGEFIDEKNNYDKNTLTYFDADEVIVDDQEEPIHDTRYYLGADFCPEKFGLGSGDSDVVYIRNENISTDFEVIRVEGSYSETVLGLDVYDNEKMDVTDELEE